MPLTAQFVRSLMLKLDMLRRCVTPGHRIGSPKPKKRALLIGINYMDLNVGEGRLVTPQEDVELMRVLLIEKFGYEGDNVVVLMDKDGYPQHLQPTYDNIMRELDHFIHLPRPGEKYFFMYSGHSNQRPSHDKKEEDGKDEYIIPCDAVKREDRNILDDDLQLRLVKPLAPGTSLVAILDTCHSATLLDLPHYRCNRVTGWRSTLRRSVRRAREPFWHEPVKSVVMSPISAIRRTESSLHKFCTGFCPRMISDGPYVLSISACKDSQVMYESPDGTSMTKMIIGLLQEKARPTLKELMRVISNDFQKSNDRLVKEIAKANRDMRRKTIVNSFRNITSSASFDGLRKSMKIEFKSLKDHTRDGGASISSRSLQSPQISSIKPLKMNSTLEI